MILFWDLEVFKHTFLGVFVDAVAQKETVIVCGSSSNIVFSPLRNTFVRLSVND